MLTAALLVGPLAGLSASPAAAAAPIAAPTAGPIAAPAVGVPRAGGTLVHQGLAVSDTRGGADAVGATIAVTSTAPGSLSSLRVVLPWGSGVPAQRASVRVGALVRPATGTVETPGTLRLTWRVPAAVKRGQKVVVVLAGIANPPRAGVLSGRVDLLAADGSPVDALPTATTYTGAPGCGAFRARGWVASENSRAGHEWRIPSGPSDIEAFASAVSAQCGEGVTLSVSTQAPSYTVEAYRMGSYGGVGGRLVWASGTLPGQVQPDPVVHDPTRTVVAPWTASLVVPISGGWPPGEYLLRVRSSSGSARFVPLTVRDDGSTSALLVQHAVLTWQAYNLWGGFSLYRGPSGTSADRSLSVSFDRPYAADGQSSFGDGQFLALEQPFVAWAEQRGLDLSYSTDVDLDARPALLRRHRALVLLSHDEYWTPRMRTAAESARDHGVNLVSLGANGVYWKSQLDASGPSAASQRRNLTVYRTPDVDPFAGVDPAKVTNRWRDAPTSKPETMLIGQMYDCIGAVKHGFVTAPTSWVFAGTGLGDLGQLTGVVGGENDRYWPRSAPASLQILAHTTFPCAAHDNLDSGWDLTYYTTAAKSGVFSAGTMAWICNLDASCAGHPGDTRMRVIVSRVTATVLAAFAAGPAGIKHPSVPNAKAVCARLGCVGSSATPIDPVDPGPPAPAP